MAAVLRAGEAQAGQVQLVTLLQSLGFLSGVTLRTGASIPASRPSGHERSSSFL